MIEEFAVLEIEVAVLMIGREMHKGFTCVRNSCITYSQVIPEVNSLTIIMFTIVL